MGNDPYTIKDKLNVIVLFVIISLLLLNFSTIYTFLDRLCEHFITDVVIPDINRGNDENFAKQITEFQRTVNSDQVRNMPAKQRNKTINNAFKKLTRDISSTIESRASTESEKIMAYAITKELNKLSEEITSTKLKSLSEEAREKVLDDAINKAFTNLAIISAPTIIANMPSLKRSLQEVVLEFVAKTAMEEVHRK